ncbi:hypothetical protein [Paramicrobacterium agarici]|uniref:hypothetical protein n=1 Tax=Paramicrobacterium agarici TaxID=630514 RepID=UPI00114E10C1|nr:hypothetical protein [Microbacterium agarici]TQO21610.1 hypothetical protein FB385_0419 [Microbacterium agarici]
MTLPFPQVKMPQQPARSGKPWTDSDYERLIAAVRSGLDAVQIAESIDRPQSTIASRVRMLLPVDVRQCPSDRVLPAAREAFESDDYDWRVTILQSPPPQPIVTPPPVVRRGVAGLQADDLGTIAFSLAQTGGTRCAELLTRVCAEMPSAPGAQGVAEDLAIRWLRRSGALVGWHDSAERAAHEWLASADGWTPSATLPPTTWEYGSHIGAESPY